MLLKKSLTFVLTNFLCNGGEGIFRQESISALLHLFLCTKFTDKAVDKEPYYKLHFDCTAGGKNLDL
jgi:hypothetical protein